MEHDGGSATIRDCERTAHDEGLAAGLTLALAGADPTAPPGRVAAVPAHRTPPGAVLVANRLATHEGIDLVRGTGHAPAAAATAVAARLGAVRLGITLALTEHAVEHLSHRVSGGEPTIRRQLVLGLLADVVTTTAALRCCLLAAGHLGAAVADVHDRITALDWDVTSLLGASGFLTGSPARATHVSRLTASCWVPRDGAA